MTVQELIKALQAIHHKDMEVRIFDQNSDQDWIPTEALVVKHRDESWLEIS